MCAATMLCPEHISLHSSSSGSYVFLPCPAQCPPNLGGGWGCRCPIYGWSLNRLFSALWAVGSLHINCYPLQQEASRLRLSASQNNGYKYKYLEDNLIMCLLGKTTVLSFSLRPMTLWAMGVWPSAYSIRDEFLPVEQPLNLIWMKLVICTTGIPLFHLCTHLSWQISSAVAFGDHCWVRSLMSSLLWKTAQHPLTPRKLASSGRVSWLVQDQLH